MDNLSGILAFVRSAEARNFTKAAHQLGMTPSGVSKAISRLENQFKVRLLHRTSRSVTMTSEGITFYERCRQIVADLEDAELLLSQARGAPRGMLRITLPLSVGRLHLARVIPAFVQRYPEITVEASFTDRLVDLIEEGYDVALRMGKPPDSRVVARKLTVGSLTTCALSCPAPAAGRIGSFSATGSASALQSPVTSCLITPRHSSNLRWRVQR
jgi:DNA-binding transcriptional LysR family regulator